MAIDLYVSRPVVEINASTSGVQGEVNTASNLGAGTGLFAGKVGVDLQFKSLVAGTGISFTSDSTTVTINGSGVPVTPQAANLVFAGPASGGPAIPTFRSLTNTDIPIVAATKGGTGQILYTVGDIIYADTTTTLAKRSATTNGFVLTLSAGLPVWAAPTGGLLTASNGLTVVGSDVRWGGTLTANTTILGAGKFILLGTSGANLLSDFNVASSSTNYLRITSGTTRSDIDADINQILLHYTNNNFTSQAGILMSGSNFLITESINNNGMQYAADYSSNGILNYGNRWIPDYGAVLGLTGATGAWKLASGGTLTGANTITGTTTNTIKFVFNSLAATQVNGAGVYLQNTTAAINGTQQNSPSTTWEGRGFGVTGSTNQAVAYTSYVLPVQNAGASPTAQWKLAYSVNGGAYSDKLVYDPTITGSMSSTGGGLDLRSGGIVRFQRNDNGIYSEIGVGTGNDLIFNNSIGVGFQFQQAGAVKMQYTNIGTFILNNSLTFTSSGNLTTGNNATDIARLWVAGANLSSAWKATFQVSPGAYTSLTAATEFISSYYDTNTWTWLAGTVATQRFNYFRGPTLAGASATATFTNAYTVYIDPPVVGTNATITNNWALGTNGNISIIPTNGRIIVGNTSTGMQGDGSFLYIGGITGGNGWITRIVDNANSITIASFAYSTTQGQRAGFGSTTLTNANWYFTQPAQTTTAGTPVLRVDSGAHTNLTASTELIAVNYNLAATVQFATGTLALQRAFVVQAPTYAFVGASNLTAAATFVITGAPIAGTNATIGTSYALLVNSGISSFAASTLIDSTGVATNNLRRLNTASLLIDGAVFVGSSITLEHLGNNSLSSGQSDVVQIQGASTTNLMSGSASQSLLVFSGVTNNTSSGAVKMISITHTATAVGGSFTGIDYNPTVTSITGTHLAARFVSGGVLIGGTTITNASTLLDLQSTTRALLLPRVTNIASVTTPVNGMAAYDAATDLFNFRQAGAWVTLSAGGGITNTAANNELMKSNGTNAVPSGFFSTTAGDLIMGSAALTGNRTLSSVNTAGTATLTISSQNNVYLTAGGTSNIQFNPAAGSGYVGIDYSASTTTISVGTVGTKGFIKSLDGTAASGDFIILSGGAGGANNNSGNIYIDSGAKTGSGVVGNLGLFTQSGSFGSGEKVVFIANRTTAPSGTPTGGGILYVEAGALKFKGSSGTVTTIAPA